MDKTLVSTATVANTSGKTGPVKFNPEIVDADYSSAGEFHISEIIVADEDTRDMRLVKREPSSAGVHSDFVGDYSKLSDDDETTLALGSAVGDKLSSAIPSYSSAATIIVVVLSSRAAKQGVSPANLSQGFRIGAVDYAGGSNALGDNLTRVVEVFETDPSTGVAWTDTGVSAAEPMLKVEA